MFNNEENNNFESKIFVIKTTINKEKLVAKSIALISKKEKLDIRAILVPENLKGYIFVESVNSYIIDTLIQSIPHARSILNDILKINDIEHFLIPKEDSKKIKEGEIIEVISGPFKGEKARVKRISSGQHDEITVELFDAVVPIPITLKYDTVRVLKKEENI